MVRQLLPNPEQLGCVALSGFVQRISFGKLLLLLVGSQLERVILPGFFQRVSLRQLVLLLVGS